VTLGSDKFQLEFAVVLGRIETYINSNTGQMMEMGWSGGKASYIRISMLAAGAMKLSQNGVQQELCRIEKKP
jgi:hypothetical protein